MISERAVSEDLIRDLVQCVQAARDGAGENSLFAIQCDLVLARAAGELNGLLLPRSKRHSPRTDWSNRGKYPFNMDLKSH
jgi:hypothetical protein